LALLCAPLAGSAQQSPKMFRAGFLTAGSSATDRFHAPFRERLHKLGYVDGQHVVIEYRWAEGRFEPSA
jgi:hypothetical protein